MKTRSIILLLAVVFVMVALLASCGPVEPAHQHEWTDATCTAPKTCSSCGETEGEALGHTEETLQGKAATCTEEGLTEGKKCSVCDEILLAQESISAKGHTEVILQGKDATCIETGLTEGRGCSVCGEILLAQDEIPLRAHSYDEGWDVDCNVCGATRTCAHDGGKNVLNGKAPTCTEAGLTDGETCAICGDVTKAQTSVDALTHDMSAATCTAASKCQREGCTYVEGVALGHEYDEGVITTAPGCETKGTKLFSCTREGCDESYEVDVDPTGHNYADTVVPSTCIAKGYTLHTCGNCGDSYKDNETAYAEHTYVGKETTAPECEKEGEKTYTCSVDGCGHTYTEPIAATGHSEISHEGKAATCTEDGYEAYVTCANCDYTTYKAINAKGHKGGTATCQSLAVCSVCGEAYGIVDTVNGHHYGAANCDSPATCELCGTTSGSAIGHLDLNKDHVCDRTSCNKYMGTHEDKDLDHACDYGCEETIGTCEDKDLDHDCDYGCDNLFGEHKDADKDHACDYGCSVKIGEHKDSDDKNHTCDYGCNKPVDGEVCVDVNPKNHICDECGSSVGGECADSDDNDHNCDYCDKKTEDCYGGEATCTNKAVCVECGKEYGNLLPHIYDQYNAVDAALKNAATCTTPARYYFSCSCGEVNRAEGADSFEYSDALGHSYVATVTPPTCTSAGFTTNKCSLCGDTYTSDEVVSYGHDMITDKAVAPTCTETGLSEGSHCSKCDYVIAQNVINALGHSETTDAAIAPTCTNIGLTEGKHCATCGEIFTAQTVLPMAHSFVDGVCTSCEVSANIFTDKIFVPTEGVAAENIYSASFGYGTLTDGIIYQEGSGRFSSKQNGGIVEATLNLEGNYLLSEFRVYLYWGGLNKLGSGMTVKIYSGDAWITVVECTTPDELRQHWSDDPESDKDWLIFDLTGYSANKIMFTIPGQTSDGWTTLYEIECSGKLEGCVHNWNDATCTAPKTCSKCGATEGEALPHTEVIDAAVAATCTSTGLTEGKHCSVCEKVLVAQQVIPMHNFVNGECSECGINLNILLGKEFVPTADALASVLSATWWKGSGYAGLTDGIKNADNAPGRFSTVMATTGMMDATVDLGVAYKLDYFRIYVYEVSESNVTALTNVGADLLIQVYANGEWTDVVNCADNAAICDRLIVVSGANNNYIEFNLNGVIAEKVRFYISASASDSGTTFQEFECVGKKHGHTHEWIDATCASPKTCATCGDTEGEALPHTEVIDAAVAATCTSTGLTEGKHCATCGEIFTAQTVLPMAHSFVDGVCTSCEVSANIFTDKTFVPTEGVAAENIYSANYGYGTLTDGIIYQEGSGRFSSKKNGGIVEATVNLEGIYALSEFKVYLYKAGLSNLGTGLTVQIYSNDEWITVVDCTSTDELQKYWSDNSDSEMDWLIFDLTGYSASKIKFTIPGQTTAGWTTLYEIECVGKKLAHTHEWTDANCTSPKTCATCGDTEGSALGHNYVSGVCSRCGSAKTIIENVLAGKTFTPTADALASVLSANWWKGSGYAGLTDGIKNADNDPGRFATVMATTGMMDATVDLGMAYELQSLKFYTYDPAAGTTAGSLGANLLIQVYANGEWTDVVTCSDNASIAAYLVVNDGTYNDYLEFDLGGITAEKVRFYISASASGSGTSFEEIECTGYEK